MTTYGDVWAAAGAICPGRTYYLEVAGWRHVHQHSGERPPRLEWQICIFEPGDTKQHITLRAATADALIEQIRRLGERTEPADVGAIEVAP